MMPLDTRVWRKTARRAQRGVPTGRRSAYVPAVPRVRPACMCPVHPDCELIAPGGGAARGICPADGHSYQIETPEVTA
jgi:hypothetical protein